MEQRGDRLLSSSIGRNISIFYNDTASSVSFKTGKFLDFDLYSLKILETGKKEPTLIPRKNCIRIEIFGEMNYAQTR